MNNSLHELVIEAQSGNHTALEDVVRNIQDDIYHLSMRILVNLDDAEDATQEVLILIITKLSTFERKSSFKTWVYRVAVNYLLNAKKVKDRDLGLNFELFRQDLEAGLASDYSPPAENMLLLNELRIACTMAMLLCLDMKHRIAYVLGDILELDHNEATKILGVTKGNYRKRLSRARADVIAFTSKSCGLVNESAKCSCPNRLPSAMELGRVRLDSIKYATKQAPDYTDVLEKTNRLEETLRVLCLQKATPQFTNPKDFGEFILQIMEGNM